MQICDKLTSLTNYLLPGPSTKENHSESQRYVATIINKNTDNFETPDSDTCNVVANTVYREIFEGFNFRRKAIF